ncbi:MAG: insulinase family protein [Alphaproteobacteria bacterium]|nr:insulinase family protein [Alphaproteobacteria bacterium]
MRKIIYALFVIALAVTTPSLSMAQNAAPDTRTRVFNAESFTLANGMTVVVIPNHRVPVITHMVWYRVGAADEPVGKSGIAHFLEHLMFKGTDTMKPGEFSKVIRGLGGNDNAFTSQDYTAYFQSISVEHLEKVMTMEASRMRGLNPPLAEVDSERQVILEERRQRIENDPRAYMAEQMRYALFPNHPYGTPNIGWASEMAELSWDDAKAMYDTWYAPNNAILVVAGDVKMETFKPLAEKIYGGLVPEDVPERQWRTIPPLPGTVQITLHHPTFRQPLWQRYYRVPSYRQNKEDSLALQVLENILSGGAATRLYKNLVVDQKIATSVNLGYQSEAWADTTLSVGAIPADGKSVADVEAAIEEQLRILIRDGVTDTELHEAKTRMKDAADFARDSLAGPAMVIGAALVTGGELDDVEYWPYDIEAVTAAQVQDVAQRFLNPDDTALRPHVTGLALPMPVTATPAPTEPAEAAE